MPGLAYNHDVAVGLHIACDRGGNGEYFVKQVVILSDGMSRLPCAVGSKSSIAMPVRLSLLSATMVPHGSGSDIRLQIGGNRLDLRYAESRLMVFPS